MPESHTFQRNAPDIFVHSYTATGVAAAAALVGVLVSIVTIALHVNNYTRKHLQRDIVRILFVIPIYAVFSTLSLGLPDYHVYFDTVRDVWEAVVVYCFLGLILEYCGGEAGCISQISQHPGSVKHMWPLDRCLPVIPLDARFLKECKRWTLQFVVVKPVMALLSVILSLLGFYQTTAYQIMLGLVYNVSCFGALYALFLFYLATRYHPSLEPVHPVTKFMSVKIIVFATYWQTFVISLIPFMPLITKQTWENFVLCLEMPLFAVLQFVAFPIADFRAEKIALKSAAMSEPGVVGLPHSRRKSAFKNVGDAIKMGDVAKDAYYNFHRKYKAHLRLNDELGSSEADARATKDGRAEAPPATDGAGSSDPFGLLGDEIYEIDLDTKMPRKNSNRHEDRHWTSCATIVPDDDCGEIFSVADRTAVSTTQSPTSRKSVLWPREK